MTDKTINTSIEILGKLYPVRCLESEVKCLQQAAALLNQEMSDIKESGKVINLERIAIVSALNIAHKLLLLDTEKKGLMSNVNQRLVQLQTKLETAINKPLQTELIYSTE